MVKGRAAAIAGRSGGRCFNTSSHTSTGNGFTPALPFSSAESPLSTRMTPAQTWTSFSVLKTAPFVVPEKDLIKKVEVTVKEKDRTRDINYPHIATVKDRYGKVEHAHIAVKRPGKREFRVLTKRRRHKGLRYVSDVHPEGGGSPLAWKTSPLHFGGIPVDPRERETYLAEKQRSESEEERNSPPPMYIQDNRHRRRRFQKRHKIS
ncbi:uncharacterized protein EV422DRAFT_510125 [Fimicolochytrium jonesii]|uniref:uncharacterized protein n=1 Tax=Fimicolochytrium jonesii TaxID=1396493 RepID=UPI0022FF10D0|nr:uncharacterized protein EV422DRAFT_510125 [Fimicolochytrium jonesii]KAI8815996.1 hypothetical protein EV422DRAFT_510125 [Fimicolochytrium jonesii]